MSSQCIVINGRSQHHFFKMWFSPPCDSHSHLSFTLLHKANTHTSSFLDDNMSFIFYILKVYYLQTKSTKKDQKDFLTNTVCLHIVVRKFTFIFLFPPLQVTNRQFLYPPSRGFTWMSWTMTMWAGLQRTEQLVIVGVTVAPPSSISTVNVIGKHMKTMVATTKPNIWFVLSGLCSQFFLHPLIFFFII